MKKLTKLLSLALAILMVMSLAGAAFADGDAGSGTDAPVETSTVITISPSVKDAQYTYYKLMSATLTVNNGNNAYSYSVNAVYKPALTSVLGLSAEASDQAICDEMRKIKDSEKLQFANKLYAALTEGATAADATGTTTAAVPAGSAEGTAASATINGVYGYYLIAQTSTPAGSATSPILLDTVTENPATIAPKIGNAPASSKKVIEFDDSTNTKSAEQDAADYDINDLVPFVLKGRVVSDISSYSKVVEGRETGHYTMIFHDDPSDGLTFEKDNANFVVSINHTADPAVPEDQKLITVPEAKYKKVYPAEGKTTLDDGCPFHIEIDLLKIAEAASTDTEKFNYTPHANDIIRVDFKMRLNSKAVAGSKGNPNESWIQYSNQPFTNSLGQTPKDKVIIFTYDLVVNKEDGHGNPLEGAKFKLYKYDADSGKGELVGEQTGTNTVEQVNGEDKVTKVSFNWHGLDAGKYRLEESVVPEGYTKADDVYFMIKATYDDNKPDPKFGKLTIQMLNTGWTSDVGAENPFEGISTDPDTPNQIADPSKPLTLTIKNQSGTVLPSTGGIGTTLFYVFGSVLVIGAGVMLISKKRMGAVD